jgi:hypothetical protein
VWLPSPVACNTLLHSASVKRGSGGARQRSRQACVGRTASAGKPQPRTVQQRLSWCAPLSLCRQQQCCTLQECDHCWQGTRVWADTVERRFSPRIHGAYSRSRPAGGGHAWYCFSPGFGMLPVTWGTTVGYPNCGLWTVDMVFLDVSEVMAIRGPTQCGPGGSSTSGMRPCGSVGIST